MIPNLLSALSSSLRQRAEVGKPRLLEAPARYAELEARDPLQRAAQEDMARHGIHPFSVLGPGGLQASFAGTILRLHLDGETLELSPIWQLGHRRTQRLLDHARRAQQADFAELCELREAGRQHEARELRRRMRREEGLQLLGQALIAWSQGQHGPLARLQRSGGESAWWQGWQSWRADPPALQLRARDLTTAAFPEQARSGLPLLDLTGGEGVVSGRLMWQEISRDLGPQARQILKPLDLAEQVDRGDAMRLAQLQWGQDYLERVISRLGGEAVLQRMGEHGRALSPTWVAMRLRLKAICPALQPGADERGNTSENLARDSLMLLQQIEARGGSEAQALAAIREFQRAGDARTLHDALTEHANARDPHGGGDYPLPLDEQLAVERWVSLGARRFGFRRAGSNRELQSEGRLLAHCVGGYGQPVKDGHSAIVLMHREGGLQVAGRLTIELRLFGDGLSPVVAQARGERNRAPTPEEAAAVSAWAQACGVHLDGHSLHGTQPADGQWKVQEAPELLELARQAALQARDGQDHGMKAAQQIDPEARREVLRFSARWQRAYRARLGELVRLLPDELLDHDGDGLVFQDPHLGVRIIRGQAQ